MPFQHPHLETHYSITWMDEHNRLNVRTSSQTPYITRQKLCFIFDLYPDTVRVFCERVGGGFGGKQEVLTEDICALVTLKTGRPAMLEFTREEAFIGATTRHPMDVQNESWCTAGRNPDRVSNARCLQHGRLWQSWGRDVVRRLR